MRYCSKPKTRICLFLGLPCGPVVKTLLCNAGDTGSIPGQRPKIPHPVEQLRQRACTPQACHHSEISRRPQLIPDNKAKCIN